MFREFVVNPFVVKVFPAAIGIFRIQEPYSPYARVFLQLAHNLVETGVLKKIHKLFTCGLQHVGIGLCKDAGINTIFTQSDLFC
jgi:hypothetical protein